MKLIQKTQTIPSISFLEQEYFTEDAVFIDIETTGLSAANSFIYLIGCVSRNGMELCFKQFFAENSAKEPEILLAFFEFIKTFRKIITFRGVDFDLPFIEKRCRHYGQEIDFSGYEQIDLYKKVTSIKKLLQLPNYRQKTIETFLGIQRADICNGKELIALYQEYSKTASDKALETIMLHNFEDLSGMTKILSLLAYENVLSGQYQIISVKKEAYQSIGHQSNQELFLTLKNIYAVPQHISCRYEEFYIHMDSQTTQIRIPIFHEDLKFFYPNYRDYYYLPDEDLAIHKSVAAFVDKEHKVRCKAGNCYTRRQGEFLIQYESLLLPEFRREYKDTYSFGELKAEYFEVPLSEEATVTLKAYIGHIFKRLTHR